LMYTGGSKEHRSLELDAAIAMGWPDTYHYLSRQDWRRSMREGYDPLGKLVAGNVNVNGWLLHLLNLDTPDGQAFRVGHSYLVHQTADKIVEGRQSVVDMRALGFLFLDPQLGNQSPAATYWPKFVQ